MFDTTSSALTPADIVAAIPKPPGLDEAAARLRDLVNREAEKRRMGRQLRLTPSDRAGENDALASRYARESNEMLPLISRALAELEEIRGPYVERVDRLLDDLRAGHMKTLAGILAAGEVELPRWQNQRRTSFDASRISALDLTKARAIVTELDGIETERRRAGSASWLSPWSAFDQPDWGFVAGRITRLLRFP